MYKRKIAAEKKEKILNAGDLSGRRTQVFKRQSGKSTAVED